MKHLKSGTAVLILAASSLVLNAAVPTASAPVAQADSQSRAGDTDWRFFNHLPDGRRFSTLSDINTETVAKLGEVCRVRVDGPGPFQSGLLLVDGMMYLTTSRATIALNPVNCDILWKSVHTPTQTEVFPPNRGAAYVDGLVVRGTADGRLVAYDALSGRERWNVTAGDPRVGEFISSAPLAWNGIIYVGLAGGDWGIQGRMMAFDARNGEKIWSFNTVPHPGEYGNDTWAGDSWRHGGGGTWTSYALDPETGELFVPVANPSPDFVGSVRLGDNLFTNSVVALDARSGKRLWHYQTRKHDTHDYGVSTPPVLLTLKDGSRVVAVAAKDGFLYVIDRRTHKLRYRVPVTTILNHEKEPTAEGVRYCPGIFGGAEWNSASYDPEQQSLVVGAVDWCSTVKQTAPVPYVAGGLYFGGTFVQDERSVGRVTAFDAQTGAVRWQHEVGAPVVSAVTATAGGVTFAGDMDGMLYAFRSSNGEILRKIDVQGALAGGIITYRASGRQYLAMTTGNISRTMWPRANGVPTLVIYALPAQSEAQAAPAPGDPVRGRTIFQNVCASCHSIDGSGGTSGRALKGVATRYSHDALVEFIKKPSGAMPALYPGALSEQDVADVSRFIETLQ